LEIDQAFRDAIAADEGFALAHIALARTLQVLGRGGEAKAALERALALAPTTTARDCAARRRSRTSDPARPRWLKLHQEPVANAEPHVAVERGHARRSHRRPRPANRHAQLSKPPGP
jgi:hypothetical protein